MMRKTGSILLSAVLLTACLAGCGRQEAQLEERPWAAKSETAAATTVPETTQREEMTTMASLETDGVSITLPAGVTAQDVETMQTVLWRAFFYRDADFSAGACADALAYLTDGATPWGLLCIYDAVDPAHTHGEYTQHSVETEPDPRGLFPDVYYRADDGVMAFLLQNVFGVQPDASAQSEGVYCEDGVWYFNSLATGMEKSGTTLHAWQTVGGNHYRLTAELLRAQSETDMAHEKSAFVDIALREADGLRVWQILKVETFE